MKDKFKAEQQIFSENCEDAAQPLKDQSAKADSIEQNDQVDRQEQVIDDGNNREEASVSDQDAQDQNIEVVQY